MVTTGGVVWHGRSKAERPETPHIEGQGSLASEVHNISIIQFNWTLSKTQNIQILSKKWERYFD